ncbi:uncharacterized protein IUM83_00222 [Phytophthora cinnamomi]|uniref:uncharacterized protein n=1 Tax=Phytophthora cinnamomi TaxID=4785 RepID=UPI00355A3897|nr:hypothetical protein IUM83_00222 [Phytophthora cinnamomi]
MFSSWDLVRPRFWYPMSSLEQSMMELEQTNDLMMRPHYPLGVQLEVPTMTAFIENGGDSDSDSDDDDFFVDLPAVAHKRMPTAFQLEVVPEAAPEEDEEKPNRLLPAAANSMSDTDTSTNMEVDDEGADRQNETQSNTTTSKAEATACNSHAKVQVKANVKTKRHNKNNKYNKQLRQHSYKVTPSTERKTTSAATPDYADCHTFSSCSFSNSSVVDDKGRRVTTTRRRYEDSTGRLKAVHEREIDGKKLRATWSRQNKQDEGRHESICSSCSPEEFEVLWQQTPFGEEQKKTVEKEVEPTAAALEDSSIKEVAAKAKSAKGSEKSSQLSST